MEFGEVKDYVTFGVALVGAVLGVLNYWRAVARDRVKLKVTPSEYFNDRVKGLCIEVVNLGWVPVTVTQVSIEVGAEKDWLYFEPVGERLPKRLEPRESLKVLLPPDQDREPRPRLADARRAFAKTACGLKFTGTSPSFRQWRDRASKGTG